MNRHDCPGPGWYHTGFRVRYCETDAAGVVHHASYLAWFEEGRSELARQLGMPYRELEREGIVLVVTQAEAHYRRAARYDERIRVWTRLREVQSRRCIFEYRVMREADGELLCEGTTVHVAIRRSTGHPARIPDPFLHCYQAAAADAAG